MRVCSNCHSHGNLHTLQTGNWGGARVVNVRWVGWVNNNDYYEWKMNTGCALSSISRPLLFLQNHKLINFFIVSGIMRTKPATFNSLWTARQERWPLPDSSEPYEYIRLISEGWALARWNEVLNFFYGRFAWEPFYMNLLPVKSHALNTRSLHNDFPRYCIFISVSLCRIFF